MVTEATRIHAETATDAGTWGREAITVLKEVKKREESQEKIVLAWNREKTVL